MARRLWGMWIPILLLLLGAAPAFAQADPAGRWALRADGRTLMILELRRERDQWSGSLARPARFQMSPSGVFRRVEGPIRRRGITAVAASEGSLRLRVDSGNGAADTHLFTLDGEGARLSFADDESLQLPLVRAGEGEEVATFWPGERSFPVDRSEASNSEMAALFAADQAARQNPARIDWAIVAPQDAQRRSRTRELLDSGALRTGDDFYQAAYIFQHGTEPGDYLLAHTLAMIAVARDRADALWIASAALDRYLQAVGEPQIYGTQYMTPDGRNTTQEPYDRKLVSDRLREALGVSPQTEQEARRAEIEAGCRSR
jgi:hypothetical protein